MVAVPTPPAGRQGQVPVAANGFLTVSFVSLGLFQLLLLPAWLLPADPRWGWALVPAALATTTFWALIHESFHGGLHPDRATNQRLGRLLCVPFGAPFRLLRFGHLMHHRLSRTRWERTEVTEATPVGVACRIGFYARLLLGLYAAELAANAAAFLPRTVLRRWAAARLPGGRSGEPDLLAAAERQLLSPAALAELRTDAAAVCVLLVASASLYGPYWPLLLAFLAARGLLVSFLDNAYHYGTPLDDPRYAQDLRLPSWASRAVLHFNLHGVHHRYPTLPWPALPARFAAEQGHYAGDLVPMALRQLAGPIPSARLPVRAGSAAV